VLKIFKSYCHGTSILDDFDFYEGNENTCCARKEINADSLHEARLSYFGTADLKSMVRTSYLNQRYKITAFGGFLA
jgi:hypothetical protein